MSEKTTKKAPKKKMNLAMFLNGEFLNRDFFFDNIYYIAFIIGLFILLVGKSYLVRGLNRDIANTQRELDQVSADYVEAKSRLEIGTRGYKIAHKLKHKNLVESQNAIKVIRVKK